MALISPLLLVASAFGLGAIVAAVLIILTYLLSFVFILIYMAWFGVVDWYIKSVHNIYDHFNISVPYISDVNVQILVIGFVLCALSILSLLALFGVLMIVRLVWDKLVSWEGARNVNLSGESFVFRMFGFALSLIGFFLLFIVPIIIAAYPVALGSSWVRAAHCEMLENTPNGYSAFGCSD